MKKQKLVLKTVAAICVLAGIEQTGWINMSYSRFSSYARNTENLTAAGDCYSRQVSFHTPVTRWIPFIKFGEAVDVHQFKIHSAKNEFLLRKTTTVVSGWIVGLSSTAKFEKQVEDNIRQSVERYSKL